MIDTDRLFVALGTVLTFLFAPLLLHAADPHVYISEVGWAGSSKSQADEWMELANPTAAAVDLSGWSLQGAGSSGSAIVLPDGSVIEAYSTFLVANYDADNEKSTLATTPHLATTALSLSNSALHLTLLDAAGVVVDEAGDGGVPPAGISTSGGIASMVFLNGTWHTATTSVGFDEDATELGTPGTGDFSAASATDPEPTVILSDSEEAPSVIPSEAEARPDEPVGRGSSTESEESSSQNDTESDPEPANPSSEPSVASSDPAPTVYPVGTLVISDYLADPSRGESEWVEVKNPYNNVIPLDGWRVTEAGGRSLSLPDQYLGWEQTVRVTFTASALNNGGDTITLLDPTGTVIDEVTYAPEPEPEPESGPVSPDDAEDASPATPAKDSTDANVTVASPIDFTGLRLSELYPNTDGIDAEHEFIEIENAGNESLDLFGVTLGDNASDWTVERHYQLDPGEVVAFSRTDFGFALNNSGQETVRLLSPTGDLLDEITYESAPQACAFARFTAGWSWTATPSPHEPNILSQPDPETEPLAGTPGTESTHSVSVEIVRKVPGGTPVELIGIVTATPGTLGDQILYMSGDGVQVYKHDGEWPEMNIGDVIAVSGTVSSNRGETRIKVGRMDTVEVIGSSVAVPPVPVDVLSENVEGQLVIVQGRALRVQKDRIALEVAGEELSVRIKEGTEIDTSLFAVGDLMSVTGVVRQIDDKYQLLPRSLEDLKRLDQPAPAQSSLSGKEQQAASASANGLWLLAATLIPLMALYVRHRRRARDSRARAGGRLSEPASARV
jgi:hypothetical protein